RARLDQLPVAVPRLEVLPAGDGDRAGRLYLAPGDRVVPRARLLEPAWLVGRQVAGQPLSLRGRESAMSLDEQVHIGADRIAHCRHDLKTAAPLGWIQLHRARSKRIDLHGGVAAPDHLPRSLGNRLRRPLDGVPAVGVAANSGTAEAADQLPD